MGGRRAQTPAGRDWSAQLSDFTSPSPSLACVTDYQSPRTTAFLPTLEQLLGCRLRNRIFAIFHSLAALVTTCEKPLETLHTLHNTDLTRTHPLLSRTSTAGMTRNNEGRDKAFHTQDAISFPHRDKTRPVSTEDLVEAPLTPPLQAEAGKTAELNGEDPSQWEEQARNERLELLRKEEQASQEMTKTSQEPAEAQRKASQALQEGKQDLLKQLEEMEWLSCEVSEDRRHETRLTDDVGGPADGNTTEERTRATEKTGGQAEARRGIASVLES